MYPADSPIVSATELHTQLGSVVILDCRFSLVDPDEGAAAYREAHLPGAHYLHLERQLSAPTGLHGGRHPKVAGSGLIAAGSWAILCSP